MLMILLPQKGFLNTEGMPYSIEKEGVFKVIINQDSVPSLTRILIKNDIDIF